MSIRAVFFDLDGTLVDSLEDLTDAVNHIRTAFSRPPLTTAAVRKKVGKGSRNLVQRVLPGLVDSDIDRALAMFLEFNRQHVADKSRLYPGIPEMLDELAARDIKMAVISNKNESLSTLILQVLGIRDRFASISGGDTFPERKPSPLPLLNALDQFGLAAGECIMVGDSINDIQAGKRAHIPAVACSWGYGGTDELTGADYLARSPQELLATINTVSGARS